jgi:ribonuclease HII
MEPPSPAQQFPDYSIETAAAARGHEPVAGIDEAGRGPWAGPVVASAVILDPEGIPSGLDDSKRLSEACREELYAALLRNAKVSIGVATVDEIDSLNILNAALLAMRRAAEGLVVQPKFALIDGNRAPDLACLVRTIVKGDQKCLSIAAASIVAKVTRDRIMTNLAADHPAYGWDSNKGYGTKKHQVALSSHGVTQHHRRSFKPIHNMLYQYKS